MFDSLVNEKVVTGSGLGSGLLSEIKIYELILGTSNYFQVKLYKI